MKAFKLMAIFLIAASVSAAGEQGTEVLAGTWTLVAADIIHPDGSRSQDYGPAPSGLLMIDRTGHYSLQIYNTARVKFASNDKLKGTSEEYRDAVLGASIHFGTISVDPVARVFTLQVERSSFPNWEGRPQTRSYELKDSVLSYRVAARPDGNIPVSVWRRVK